MTIKLPEASSYVTTDKEALAILIENNNIGYDLFKNLLSRVKKLERRNSFLTGGLFVASGMLVWLIADHCDFVDTTNRRVKTIESQLADYYEELEHVRRED